MLGDEVSLKYNNEHVCCFFCVACLVRILHGVLFCCVFLFCFALFCFALFCVMYCMFVCLFVCLFACFRSFCFVLFGLVRHSKQSLDIQMKSDISFLFNSETEKAHIIQHKDTTNVFSFHRSSMDSMSTKMP